MLTTRPLPSLLREALRNVEDIDTRENLRPQDLTPLDERISITLRLQATEHVGQWMGLKPDELIDQLITIWSASRPEVRACDWASSLSRRDDGDLEGLLGRSPGHIDIDLVIDRERDLLALCAGPFERAEARHWFTANRSAARYLRVVAEETRALELLRARHLRIRNAIVHGSPVNAAAVASVGVFARSLASTSIMFALDAHLSGGSPRSALDHEIDTVRARRHAAENGRPPVDKSASGGTGAP